MYSNVNNFNLVNILLIVISLIKTIISECGLPAIPPNAKIDSFEFSYSEDTQIEYYCELPELVLLNGKTRTCKNGQWVGPIPFCAEELGENTIEKIQTIDKLNKKQNISKILKSIDGKAFVGNFDKGECIRRRRGSIEPLTFILYLNKKYAHISYFEIVIHAGKAINTSELLLESITSSVRTCTASVVEPAVAPSFLLRLKLICDLVSNTDDETLNWYYTDDFTTNITLIFDSNVISICEIRLFYSKLQSPHQCGSPDTPLHSTADLIQLGSKYGAMPHYSFTCDKNFELIGNQEVRCGINNYWLDEFPACVPKVKCPVPPDASNYELVTIRAVYIDFYTFYGKDVAIPGSYIIYTCDESQNSSEVMIGDSVRVCTETGQWSGIQPYCLDLTELKVDKYSEVFEQQISNQTSLEIRYQNESLDCGLPAIPVYAKPAPSRLASGDIRTHYPNGTSIRYRCESSYRGMYSIPATRKCVNRKWSGKTASCELAIPDSVRLSNIVVSNHSRIISEWEVPERNLTTTTTTQYHVYYGAYSNWNGKCAPFNLSAKQEIILKLNDTQHISSFYMSIRPGGIYGGFKSYGAKKNMSAKPLIAKVGLSICKISVIYDYQPHMTYVFFDCNDGNPGTDYSTSGGVDQIVIYVNPSQFDKKFVPQNGNLCSLSLYHSSENCGTPERPLNSIVSLENRIAYYSCEPGFELIGPNEVMCLPNGRWAQEFPICKMKLDLCPMISHNFGIVWEYTNTVNSGHIVKGTLTKSQCLPVLPGFVGKPLLVGSRTRICMSTGQWSGSKPFCIDSSKYKANSLESFSLTTKALTIIIVVSISTIVVIIIISLIICFHLTQKCYLFCNLCLKRESTEDKSDVNHKIVVRPESQIDINEINETLNRINTFIPHDNQADC